MRLLIALTSPYARKPRIVIAEKLLGGNFPHVGEEAVNPWKNNAGIVAFNPLNKIPVLILEDGARIIDSCAIVEFLDAQGDVPCFIPSEPKLRAQVKAREALADGITDAVAGIIMAGRVLGSSDKVPAKWREWQLEKARRAIAEFSGALNKRGEDIDLGDIALGCALGFLDFRLPDFAWRGQHPALADWFDKISQRDSFASTAPKEARAQRPQ